MTSPNSSSNRRSTSKDRKHSKRQPRPVAPTKAETARLPPFEGLSLEQIQVPRTPSEFQSAAEEIFAAGLGGFDTEARPTFEVGEKSDGPHVVQFAIPDKAFIFQLHRNGCEQVVADLISSKEVLKVGFGLKNDRKQILSRFGIELEHVLDLDQIFRKLGYRGQVGVRGAVGAILNKGFKKSKSITTSNWANHELRPGQLLYAANDAFGALKIMEALKKEGHIEL